MTSIYEEWELDPEEVEQMEAWVASNPRKAAILLVLIETALTETTIQTEAKQWNAKPGK